MVFLTVVKNASDIGMSVNERKTQLLCISSAIDSDVSSYIRLTDDLIIRSGQSLKIVGFHFGSKPNVDVHIEKVLGKARSRSGVVRNLKRSG